MTPEPSYDLNYADNSELDDYVEESGNKHDVSASPDGDFNRVYFVVGSGWAETMTFVRREGEGDYWEASGVSDKDLDKVLETLVKKAKAEKRQVTFTVTLDLDADLVDDQKQLKQAATTLAEFVVKSRKRLAPTGTNLKRATVSFRGGSIKKNPPAKKSPRRK